MAEKEPGKGVQGNGGNEWSSLNDPNLKNPEEMTELFATGDDVENPVAVNEVGGGAVNPVEGGGAGGAGDTGEGGGAGDTGEGGQENTGEGGGAGDTGEGGNPVNPVEGGGAGGAGDTGEGGGAGDTGEGGQENTGEGGGASDTGEGGQDDTGEGGQDDTGEQDQDDAEKREAKEAELLKQIKDNYSSDIFAAARAMGKNIAYVDETYQWSTEDKEKLVDTLTHLDEILAQQKAEKERAAAGNGGGNGGDGGNGGGNGGEGAGGDGGNGGGNGGENAGGDGNGPNNRENTSEQREKGRRKVTPKGVRKLLGIALLAGLSGLGGLVFGGRKNTVTAKNEVSTEQEYDGGEEEDLGADVGNVIENEDSAEDNESLSFKDNYKYFNDIERKAAKGSWMNAGDYAADLINSGDIEVVQNSDGTYRFADKEAAYRAMAKGAFKMNREQAGTCMGYARNGGLFTDFISEGTVQAGEAFCESNDNSAHAAAIYEWNYQMDKASFDEVILNGMYENNFIREKGGNDTIEGSGDGEAFYTSTDETGRKVVKATFENGSSMLFKCNLDDAVITKNADGSFAVVLKDADGNEYRYCFQPLAEQGTPVNVGTPENNETPEDDTEKEKEKDSTPDKDKTKKKKDKVKKPKKEKTTEEKTEEKNEQAEIDNAGPNVDKQKLDESKTPKTENPKTELDNYNPETKSDDTGEDKHKLSVDGNEQKENIENGDTTTKDENGNKVSEDVNGKTKEEVEAEKTKEDAANTEQQTLNEEEEDNQEHVNSGSEANDNLDQIMNGN